MCASFMAGYTYFNVDSDEMASTESIKQEHRHREGKRVAIEISFP